MPQRRRPENRTTPIEVARLMAGNALPGAAAKTQIGRGASRARQMSDRLTERNAAPLRPGWRKSHACQTRDAEIFVLRFVPRLQLRRDHLLEFHDIGRELADTFC
jgi:hypothetical protein